MRDLTVLSQLAAHLDGWSDLRARVATEIDWPSVHVARVLERPAKTLARRVAP